MIISPGLKLKFYNAAKAGDATLINQLIQNADILEYVQLEYLPRAAGSGHIEIVELLLMIDSVKASAAALNNLTLRSAAANGHTNIVRLLLDIPAVKTNAEADDNYALRIAAEEGHKEIVELLLKIDSVKANAEAQNNQALRYAAGSGHIEIVELLLMIDSVKARAATQNNGALRYAARNGHKEIVGLLLKIDSVKTNAEADDNDALRNAAEYGHIEIVRLLLEIPAVIASAATAYNVALRCAAEKGHKEIVELLLKIDSVKANAAARDNYALCNAAAHGYAEIVELLLKIDSVKASAAAQNNGALRSAAANGHTNIVRLLLDIPAVKANAAADDNYALRIAAENGHTEIVELLLKIDSVKANAEADDNYALRYSAKKGHKEIVRLLLEIPAVIASAATAYNVALRIAAENGHTEIVELLLKIDSVKANAAARDNEALRWAAGNGRKEIVELLLKSDSVKANAEADDNYALRYSAEKGHKEIVELLLKIDSVKANAAARDNEALRWAAGNGHAEIVELLLKSDSVKANAAARDNYALRFAAKNNHTEIVKLLLDIDTVNASAAADDNYALRYAARNGNTDIVKRLLEILSVAQLITANDHAALSDALSNSHWDVVLVLLQHYGTNSIPQSLVTQAFGVPSAHPAAAGIKAIICNRVMTVSGRYNATSQETNAINAWVAHWGLAAWPAGVAITNSSWCVYLSEQAAVCKKPKQAAIILLSLNAMAENHQRHLNTQQLAAGGGESAMESSLVAMVAKHYREQIEPAFGSKFKALGDVEGVEQLIKWVLLNKIADKADEPLKSQIQAKKQNILNGVEEDILWARNHFTAKDDIYQTAWRAYDAGAKPVGWKNLLTAPSPEDANEAVFSTAETGSRGEDLQTSSDIIRRMAAHYYMVAIDERLTNEERDVALESFVAAIAEIRRAHNDDAMGEDNPSCFPGCFTRLHEVTKRNPHITNIKPGLMAALREAYINELEKAVTAGYMSCNEAQALILYEALNMLSSVNAWDVISHPEKYHCMSTDDGEYTEALLKARQVFIEEHLPLQTFFQRLQNTMINRNQIAMNEDDAVLVQALLADVSAGETAPYIESAYQKRLEALNSKAEPTAGMVRLSTSAVSAEPAPSPGPSQSPGSGLL